MAVWYTSDLHLGHQNIISLSSRPFASTEEMNHEIIDRWNAVVAPSDTVMMLGDICMGKLVDSLELIKQLKGFKYLVPGNHDRVFPGYKGSVERKLTWYQMYLNAGFTVSSMIHLPAYLRNDDVEIDLCHFPFTGDSHESDRYASERPVDRGQVLWHGHVHETWKQNGRQINVGVDVWDFYPVAEEELIEMSLNTS